MRPGQVAKFLCLMAWINVEGKGLHVVTCRKAVSSYFVTFEFIVLQESIWEKMVFERGIVGCFGERGMFQSPLHVFLVPSLILYFLNKAEQSYSQRVPMVMRDLV